MLELQIPGNDRSVWIAGADETEARPSAALNVARVDPTDLQELNEPGELEDYHEVKGLSAPGAAQKNKKWLLSFASAGCISALRMDTVAAWPSLANVHGHHDMLLPCHQHKDVFHQAMSKSQDRMSTQLPSCEPERAQPSPAVGCALFIRPEFWLHDGPYFMPNG